MKKNSIYTLSLVLFGAFALFIIFNYYQKQKSSYRLLDRKGVAADTREWKITSSYASTLETAVRKNPADIKSRLALVALFIQEARVTGNYSYYDQASLKYVSDVLKMDSLNFEALTFKALIYLSQHHFSEGLLVAQRAQKINPYNAFIYGILVDGYVETGNYDAAVASADKMVSIRPDIRSYARVSYLREIYGDYPGAIEAMKMAVDAGAPGDESTAWCRTQLGHLYENTGDLKSAEMHYTIALSERTDYAYALAGLARIALSAKNYREAIHYYEKADSMLNGYSFKEELVDVYKLAGENEKATAISKIVIDKLDKDAVAGTDDGSLGHYADRELAYAYLKTKNYDKALEHAMLEYNRRPDNIDVNETVAWVYYCRGDYAKALSFIQPALKTNSKNPVLLCRAGLIYAKAGDKLTAKSKLEESLFSNANITESLKEESITTLRNL